MKPRPENESSRPAVLGVRSGADDGCTCESLARLDVLIGPRRHPEAARELADEVRGACVADLLGDHHHGHVAFTEVTRLGIVDRPLQSSGELLYDAPDRLEKRTLAPKPETLLLERGTLTVQRGHRSRVLSLRDYPQIVPFIESIRATLAGDRVALERYFTVHLSGSLAQWTLELTPLDAGVAHAVQRIRIDGAGDALHSVETRQGDGDVSVLTVGASLNP